MSKIFPSSIAVFPYLKVSRSALPKLRFKGDIKAMKTYFVLTGLLASLVFGSCNAPADVGVSFGVQISARTDFYDPLSSLGAWVEVGSYGRCWHPHRIAADWRPYSAGYWEWTDVGWYWVSDE